MRALGVPELIAHLEGRLALAEAARRAKAATRQYVKRQATWFRHRAPDALCLEGFGGGDAGRAAQDAAARFLLTLNRSPA
jgi:tRNA dimethylallyltransferase